MTAMLNRERHRRGTVAETGKDGEHQLRDVRELNGDGARWFRTEFAETSGKRVDGGIQLGPREPNWITRKE